MSIPFSELSKEPLWPFPSKAKKSKYGNEKVVIDGHMFMSKREAKYYSEFKLLQMAREISQLELQPDFPILVNGIKICKVIADFSFFELDKLIVVDVKGYWTDTSRLKWKLAQACYPQYEWRIIK